MTNTPVPRFNALQSVGTTPASSQARSMARGSGSAQASALAGSSPAAFSTLLAGLETLGHPAAGPEPSTALPPAPGDASLSKAIAGEVASNTNDAAPKPPTLTKVPPKSVDTRRSAASSLKQVVPDVLPQPPIPAPTSTVPNSPLTASIVPKFAASSPVAADNEVALTRQPSAALAAQAEAPALGEPVVANSQTGPSANAFSTLSAALPKSLAATDTASLLQPGAPSASGVTAASTVQAAATPAVAKPAGLQPTQQVAPALVQLTHTANGGQLTLQLNPNELGRVHIQIDRAADGSANVQVTADRPETLQLLVADQAQLHHALDSAGLPQEGRTLSLNLAKPETSTSEGFNGGGASSGDNSAAGGRSGGEQGRPSARGYVDGSATWADGTVSATSSSIVTTRLHAGVDITA